VHHGDEWRTNIIVLDLTPVVAKAKLATERAAELGIVVSKTTLGTAVAVAGARGGLRSRRSGNRRGCSGSDWLLDERGDGLVLLNLGRLWLNWGWLWCLRRFWLDRSILRCLR
jgi:hypothetical protein